MVSVGTFPANLQFWLANGVRGELKGEEEGDCSLGRHFFFRASCGENEKQRGGAINLTFVKGPANLQSPLKPKPTRERGGVCERERESEREREGERGVCVREREAERESERERERERKRKRG